MLRSLKDYEFAFDFTFFEDEILTATVSEYLNTQRSCFENARTGSLGNQQYEITLISNSNLCRLDLTKDIYFGIYGIVNNMAINEQFELLNVLLKAGENKVTIDCSKIDGCSDEAFSAGLELVLRFQQDDIIDYSYVSGYTHSNYDVVLYIACSLGGGIMCWCLFDTISKIVIFNRVIKSNKRK